MKLQEFVLFIKLFVVTKIEISEICPNLSQEIESDIVFTQLSGSISQYILSGSLWHPGVSTIPKNKWNFLLVISKLLFRTKYLEKKNPVKLDRTRKVWDLLLRDF